MKAVVVTGVSTGIGYSVAVELARAGFRVFGSVRREEDAQPLVDEFGESFVPLVFDVTDEEGVRRAAETVAEAIGDAKLCGLVNNAGIVVPGPIETMTSEAFRHQLEVNLVGPMIVSKAFLPLLGTDTSRVGSPGRIVNISSVSGSISVPFTGAYAASKHGLEGMSGSMRRELRPYGIDVIIVAPGSVSTPIWNKVMSEDFSECQGTAYEAPLQSSLDIVNTQGVDGIPSKDVAKVVLKALTKPRPCWRYAPVSNKLMNWILPRLLPARLIDRGIARRLGIPRNR